MTNRKRELSGSGPERLLGLAWGLGDLGTWEGGREGRERREGGREGGSGRASEGLRCARICGLFENR